ncbi:Cell wall assembly regulator SMI1 [Lentzea fradiae]|uniref:Cell wall assembly regulator SMI1 n=1 Tax=Lentzea fradiae TaxID=200378 RepID=A0A1G7W4B6_9PSEU|nr:SMI1/KNR4 family protein [Lentzea fradiae]SDG66763.1 Cell wall assembly regulator SMI1 [Lentzea fradiae]
MSRTENQSWTDIESWVSENSPALHAAFLPPPSTSDVTAAEEAIGYALPAGLAAWWRRFGGIGDTGLLWGLVPGYWQPQGLRQALADRAMVMEVRNDLFSASPEEQRDQQEAALRDPAGTPHTEQWLPAWVPVATNLGGSHLFADLRDGPRHGCVMAWDNVEGADTDPVYPDVTAMLDHAARALHGGTDLRPVLDGGHLHWA